MATSIFFRAIETTGTEHIPSDGPTIFVGNHPNSLMDPLLITVTCGRKVHFAAREGLFAWIGIGWILRSLGAVPIKRRQDQKDPNTAKMDNASAFQALFDVLARGGAMGIFPEGISHTRSELAPLKTGAARIALDAAARTGQPVRIVPCGLWYRRRNRMRSQVLVDFGTPIVVHPSEPASDEERRALVHTLTEQIDAALRGQTINARDFDTLRVLEAVRRLYRPPQTRLSMAERAELTRRFVEHYERLAHIPAVRVLHDDVLHYLNWLKALGLRDRDLRTAPSRAQWQKHLVARLFLVLLWAPLAIPGGLLHLPLIVMAVLTAEGLIDRKDVHAFTKFLLLMATIPAMWACVVAAAVWFAPPDARWAIGTALAAGLPLSFLAVIQVLERQSALRQRFSALLSLYRWKHEFSRLCMRRQELRQRVLLAVDTHLDRHLARIVPAAENE